MTKPKLCPTRCLMLAALCLTGCTQDSDALAEHPVLQLSDGEIDFGVVPVGVPVERLVRVTNVGTGTLELGVPELDRTTSIAFSAQLRSARLAPGMTTDLLVRFVPQRVGEAVSVLRLPSNQPEMPATLKLTGAGSSGPMLQIDDPISFGIVVVGNQAQELVTVRNVVDRDLEVEFIEDMNVQRCGGTGPSVFCVGESSGPVGADGRFVVPAGGAVTLSVSFSPAIAGTRERGSFELRACDNSACDTQVDLTGHGIEQGLRCGPLQLDFGQVSPGTCVTRPVTCENIAHEPITISGWRVSSTPPTSDDFSSEPTNLVVLNREDRLEIGVTYCPAELGADEASLEVSIEDGGLQVGLTGVGHGPVLEVHPSAGCNFGRVSLIAPARCTFLVTNNGFDTLSISSIIADTLGTGAFTAPGAGPVDIAPGGSYTVTVEFQPNVVGPIASRLRITSNSSNIEVPLSGEGIDLPSCDFEIRPATLDFHEVLAQTSVGRAVEVYNRGAHDCLVTGVRLQPGSDVAFFGPPQGFYNLIIPPGTATSIPVGYAPQAVGDHTGTMVIALSSSTSTFNDIPLSGTAVSAGLLIYPRELDFGPRGLGCTTRPRIVRVSNPSPMPAVIDSIDWAVPSPPSNPPFALSAIASPITVPPGQSVEFDVTFTAPTVSAYTNGLVVSAQFEGQPATYAVSLSGEGARVPVQEDRFVQAANPKADFLFVVDFSPSMAEEQRSLAASFSGFLRYVQALSFDYQVGVTTMDTSLEAGRLMHPDQIRGQAFGGNVSDRIVTPLTLPDPESVFARNVQARNLGGGSISSESGFYAAYQALTAPVLTGHNAGFLRSDAALAIIFVSDEQDLSARASGAPSDDVSFYVNFFTALKGVGQAHRVSLSAIVGGVVGCNGAGGSAGGAPRYLEAVQSTQGFFQSICEPDWSTTFEQLRDQVLGFQSGFVLSQRPSIASIEVFVDVALIPPTGPSGIVRWTYDAAANAVLFGPAALPEPGAEIVIRYAPECL